MLIYLLTQPSHLLRSRGYQLLLSTTTCSEQPYVSFGRTYMYLCPLLLLRSKGHQVLLSTTTCSFQPYVSFVLTYLHLSHLLSSILGHLLLLSATTCSRQPSPVHSILSSSREHLQVFQLSSLGVPGQGLLGNI